MTEEMIELKVSFSASKVDGSEFQDSDARQVIEQIKRDVSHGTFSELPTDFWNQIPDQNEFTRFIRGLVEHESIEITPEQSDNTRKKCSFTLKLSPRTFPVANHGFQHLIGVLAGDLFYFEMPQYKLDNFIVNDLKLGSLVREAKRYYRNSNKSYSINKIRRKFQLEHQEPLLAFSLKPRLGLSSKAIEKLALDITKEKFHIVELDTRNLPTDTQFFQDLVEVATTVAEKNKEDGRVARLSLNLSFSTPKAIEMAIQLTDALSDFCVLKIDGGLDGISTCQNIRKKFDEESKIQPIITCYPLLRNRLSTAIGKDTFVEMLVLSGVDIIYPGGAPRFTGQGAGYRNIDKERLSTATEKYRKLIRQGFPMPTVAGGIHAGQLHAYYELLGPNVAYFIGGGVSLHKNGPTEGARLCRKSLDKAIQLRNNTPSNQEVQNFENELAQTMDKYERPEWMPDNVFEYVPPSFIFRHQTGIKPFSFA